MTLRTLLVALVALATIGFVTGTSIERHNARHESAAQLEAEGRTTPRSGESPAAHAAEGARAPATAEAHKELRPLGVDVEAVPFIVVAAAASLALAAAAWRRPRRLGLLAVLALAMLIFGLLDIREVVHQSDESQTALAILAAVVGALHLAAAATAGRMAQLARRPAA